MQDYYCFYIAVVVLYAAFLSSILYAALSMMEFVSNIPKKLNSCIF